MNIWLLLLAWAGVVATNSIAAAQQADGENCDSSGTETCGAIGLEQENDENENTCTLYMAPSSIPFAGYGIFTVKAFKQDEFILRNDGPNIPVVDPDHLQGDHLRILNNVWWGRNGGMSDDMRFESLEPVDFQIMFGALPNYHTYLKNLSFRQPNPILDDSMVDRYVDPGAGAFSYYLGKDFFAMENIEAGDEIFLDYSESWLDHRKEYGHVPRSKDFELGGQFLSNFVQKMKQELGDDNGWDRFLNDTLTGKLVLSTMHEAASVYGGSRASSVLPKSMDDLQHVLKAANYSMEPRELAFRLAKELSVKNRGVEWIKENGVCLDNIVPMRSTIPQAGRGAMAQRDLKEGQIIVPTPLLHITNIDRFSTFPTYASQNQETKEYEVVTDHLEARGKQLLLNYCFSHAESSLLLCPVTNAVLINHCSVRKQQCGKDGPNAMVRWATEWDKATTLWLNRSLQEIKETKQERLLTLEIVATRDIKAGEEIFMDYGAGWEEAWESHVRNWKSPTGSLEHHVSVTELNANRVPPNLTHDLRDDRPYYGNDVTTVCWYGESSDEVVADTEWKALSDEEILARYSVDGSDSVKDPGAYGHFWPCSVVSKHSSDDDTYTVRIFQSSSHDTTAWEEAGVPRFVTNLPRNSIKYVTKPYRSDLHLPDAFRHYIEISDDIFPEQWKDSMIKPPTVRGAMHQPGDRVEVYHHEHWYRGAVKGVAVGVSYDIRYVDDSQVEKGVVVPSVDHYDKEKRGNGEQLKVGDKVYGNFKERGNWFVGEIINTTEGIQYDILFDDGVEASGILQTSVRKLQDLRYSTRNIVPSLS